LVPASQNHSQFGLIAPFLTAQAEEFSWNISFKGARCRERLGNAGVGMTASEPQYEGVMKSRVVKRSIVVAGHKTSVSLEDAFWNGIKEISGLRNMTTSELVGEIDHNRQQGNLSSAIRVFVLDHFKNSAVTTAPDSLPQTRTVGGDVSRPKYSSTPT
jgi:predicted DNA-binding ribbon-helix-helix protein